MVPTKRVRRFCQQQQQQALGLARTLKLSCLEGDREEVKLAQEELERDPRAAEASYREGMEGMEGRLQQKHTQHGVEWDEQADWTHTHTQAGEPCCSTCC